jgi:hypothetical protein
MVITKSSLLECKRQFVEKKYKEIKHIAEINKFSTFDKFINWWWYKMWTCPICLGYYVALFISVINPNNYLFVDFIAIAGFNWFLCDLRTFFLKNEKNVENS